MASRGAWARGKVGGACRSTLGQLAVPSSALLALAFPPPSEVAAILLAILPHIESLEDRRLLLPMLVPALAPLMHTTLPREEMVQAVLLGLDH